jgi:hypothetical protein
MCCCDCPSFCYTTGSLTGCSLETAAFYYVLVPDSDVVSNCDDDCTPPSEDFTNDTVSDCEWSPRLGAAACSGTWLLTISGGTSELTITYSGSPGPPSSGVLIYRPENDAWNPLCAKKFVFDEAASTVPGDLDCTPFEHFCIIPENCCGFTSFPGVPIEVDETLTVTITDTDTGDWTGTIVWDGSEYWEGEIVYEYLFPDGGGEVQLEGTLEVRMSCNPGGPVYTVEFRCLGETTWITVIATDSSCDPFLIGGNVGDPGGDCNTSVGDRDIAVTE